MDGLRPWGAWQAAATFGTGKQLSATGPMPDSSWAEEELYMAQLRLLLFHRKVCPASHPPSSIFDRVAP